VPGVEVYEVGIVSPKRPEKMLLMKKRAYQLVTVQGEPLVQAGCKRRSENRPRHAVRAGDAAEER